VTRRNTVIGLDAEAVSVEQAYAVTYRAATPKRWMIIEATVSSSHDPNGNVTLQAATLSKR